MGSRAETGRRRRGDDPMPSSGLGRVVSAVADGTSAQENGGSGLFRCSEAMRCQCGQMTEAARSGISRAEYCTPRPTIV